MRPIHLTALCLTVISFAAAPLASAAWVAYDDFGHAATSATRWTAVASGAGSVDYATGEAVLDRPDSPGTGSYAEMIATDLAVTAAGMGANAELARFAFDMEILRPASESFNNLSGWHVESENGRPLEAGQQTGSGTVNQFSPTSNASGTANGGANRFHYDVLLKVSSSGSRVDLFLQVFSYVSAYDATPGSYLANETPFYTADTSSGFLDLADPDGSNAVFFRVDKDTADQQDRGKMAVDNLYFQDDLLAANGGGTLTSVPEPASLAVLAGLAWPLWMRRRRR